MIVSDTETHIYGFQCAKTEGCLVSVNLRYFTDGYYCLVCYT